jgi:hypothetical protein
MHKKNICRSMVMKIREAEGHLCVASPVSAFVHNVAIVDVPRFGRIHVLAVPVWTTW